MKITMTGASGFLGGALAAKLKEQGHVLTALGREDAGVGGYFRWDSLRDAVPVEAVEGADAVIHLAGEPVAQRWNAEVKRRIRESRAGGTARLVAAIRSAQVKPRVWIGASAVGFYGERGEEELDERSAAGAGFLGDVCGEWERAAMQAAELGVRVVLLRIGIVLHRSGGALATMLPPFRLGLGGPIGSGRQWMSWIHRHDLVAMMLWALAEETVTGVFNAVAPLPCSNLQFSKAVGVVLRRPVILPVPGFVMRVLYGEMAGAILGSQRVFPVRALQAGFKFRYPELAHAMRAAIRD